MTDLTQKMRDDWNERSETPESARRWILDQWRGPVEPFFELGRDHWMDVYCALSEKAILIMPDMIGVDLGCGVGRLTYYAAPFFGKLYATDIAKNMIEQCPAIDNVTYIVTGTLADVPEPVDLIFSHLVLQHVARRHFWKYVDEAHALLKPGGVLITQLHETPDIVDQGDSTILVRGYTKDELRGGLDESQWEIVSLLDPFGISETWKFLILRKR